jgi:nifR3 family TIM-barrel protein
LQDVRHLCLHVAAAVRNSTGAVAVTEAAADAVRAITEPPSASECVAILGGIEGSLALWEPKRVGAGADVTDGIALLMVHLDAETIPTPRFNELYPSPLDAHADAAMVQLFGEDPEVMARAAAFVESQGADFVDINLGCPVNKVVSKGAGAALLREPLELGKMLAQIKNAISIPLTIKIRTGWDASLVNASEVVAAAADAGVTWVAIHGRTRAQGYAGQADWDLIAQVKSRAAIPIIGNGDIHSARRAVERLHQSGCDGVMIGRGCLKNPWIFRQAMKLWASVGTPGAAPALQNAALARNAKLEIAEAPSKKIMAGLDEIAGELTNISGEEFCQALVDLRRHFDRRQDARYSLLQMKKFLAWFSSGYPGSQSFRRELFALKELAPVADLGNSFFSQLNTVIQSDTSSEAFLMGGHG